MFEGFHFHGLLQCGMCKGGSLEVFPSLRVGENVYYMKEKKSSLRAELYRVCVSQYELDAACWIVPFGSTQNSRKQSVVYWICQYCNG